MYVSDHHNSRLGIYGMVIPINADSLTITLLDVSNASLALIKIVGKVQKNLLDHFIDWFLKIELHFLQHPERKSKIHCLVPTFLDVKIFCS